MVIFRSFLTALLLTLVFLSLVQKAVFALDVILVVTGTLYTILLYMGIPHSNDVGGIGVAPAGTYKTDNTVKV
jgi:hypothetical protein